MTTIQVDHLKVTAADGHRLGVYRAKPTGHCRGSVLIVQEIFGLTAHIKSVADSYAAAGYEALAPQLFDRVSVDLQVPYAQWQTGLTHARSIETALTMADLEATRLAASKPDRVALVGSAGVAVSAILRPVVSTSAPRSVITAPVYPAVLASTQMRR